MCNFIIIECVYIFPFFNLLISAAQILLYNQIGKNKKKEQTMNKIMKSLANKEIIAKLAEQS